MVATRTVREIFVKLNVKTVMDVLKLKPANSPYLCIHLLSALRCYMSFHPDATEIDDLQFCEFLDSHQDMSSISPITGTGHRWGWETRYRLAGLPCNISELRPDFDKKLFAELDKLFEIRDESAAVTDGTTIAQRYGFRDSNASGCEHDYTGHKFFLKGSTKYRVYQFNSTELRLWMLEQLIASGVTEFAFTVRETVYPT